MGPRTTAVDPLALPIAAARLDAAADLLLAALRTHLADVRSGAELVAGVARWESSVREAAAALRLAADHYLESEAHGAAALR
ncbi:MAG: hypothetical protein O2892_13575 [Actinomycetota bacterium]|jgi:hypothetical protein|nr:hypothetical protein [Actinomycetota bacterium]MDA2950048.1 hypothetical protein [Actinomycetota bacterium]